MVIHVRGDEVELGLHPPDECHVGEMVNKWSHVYVNEERLIEVGFSDFEGDMMMPPSDGFDMTLIILAGSGSLEQDGGVVHRFEPGDVLIYEPPVGKTRLISNGCRYAYVTHWHSTSAHSRSGYLQER